MARSYGRCKFNFLRNWLLLAFQPICFQQNVVKIDIIILKCIFCPSGKKGSPQRGGMGIQDEKAWLHFHVSVAWDAAAGLWPLALSVTVLPHVTQCLLLTQSSPDTPLGSSNTENIIVRQRCTSNCDPVRSAAHTPLPQETSAEAKALIPLSLSSSGDT